MLKINFINYSVNNKLLLNINNLVLNDYGIYAIAGLNGSGKSLLCKSLSNNLGCKISVFYNDNDITKLSSMGFAKTIGYLDIHNVSDSFFNVRQTILSADFINSGKFENNNEQSLQKMYNILVNMDLHEDILAKDFRVLSAGERARVLLARNLMVDRPILILDEVLVNLDIKHEVQILDYLRKIAEKKIILLVHHNLSMISDYASYLIGLKNGMVCCYGDFASHFNEKFLKDCYGLDVKLIKKSSTKGYTIEF